DQVARDPLLHLLARRRRLIHVITESLTAPQQPFISHQPHLRECGVVFAAFTQLLVYLPHSSRAQPPQHPKHIQFTRSRYWRLREPIGRLGAHIDAEYNDTNVMSTITILLHLY